MGTLFEYHGLAMYDMDMALPLVPMERFHHKGLRISVTPSEDKWEIFAQAAEKESAEVEFKGENGKQKVLLKSGETVTVSD